MSKTKRLWIGVLGGFGVALVVVIGVVLPAEYSIDPLGSGRALGVYGLSSGGVSAVISADQTHRNDRMSVQLAPFESVEYSYEMERGAALVFSWQASDELVFNLHSSPVPVPAGRPANYAESFATGRRAVARGTYTAPFSGRHGWFWENRTNVNVSLTLVTAGFMQNPQRSTLSGVEALPLSPVVLLPSPTTACTATADRRCQ